VQPDAVSLDLKRYRKVRWFFIKALLHVLFWDIVLNRPLLRGLRTPPLPRWQRLSRRYRELAVDMGGVLIKLGQFLSIRVDVLPAEVTQDSVLPQTQRGDLSLRMSFAPDASRAAQRLAQAVRRLTWMVVAVGLLVSGVNLRIDGRDEGFSGLLLLGALLAFLWGLVRKSAGR
jgi:hypothetical protein